MMPRTPQDWEHVISNIDRAQDMHAAKRIALLKEGEQPGESARLAALAAEQAKLMEIRGKLLAPLIKELEAYTKPKPESEPKIDIEIDIDI